MELILDNIINNLNILYIFLCNIVTYIIIKSIPKDIPTLGKRGISTGVAVVLGAIGILWMHWDKEAVFCSFFVQFLMYDYIIKWFLDKYGVESKNDIVISEK
jgi:hypothetical protein